VRNCISRGAASNCRLRRQYDETNRGRETLQSAHLLICELCRHASAAVVLVFVKRRDG